MTRGNRKRGAAAPARRLLGFLACTVVLLGWLCLPARAASVDAGADATAVDATAVDAASVDASVGVSPEVAALAAAARNVRALVSDTLAPDAEPAALFPVDLGDAAAIDVEIARLGALLRAVEVDAGANKPNKAGAKPAFPHAGDASADADASAVEDRTPPPDRWEAQLELDRARLAFYTLPSATRAALVASHAKRRAALAPAETDAERQAREAEAERKRALERARMAATEAERLASEEYARLLAVAAAQTTFEGTLADQKAATSARREESLKAQRRAREVRELPVPDQAKADAAYDELRTVLRETRDSLDGALDRDPGDGIPTPGASPLVAMNLETDELRTLRAKLEADAARLAGAARVQHVASLAQLLDETTALNTERLALLPALSADKRAALTGFTSEGTGQAAAELRQLKLILRYHKRVAVDWARGRGAPGAFGGVGVGRALFVLLQAIVLGAALSWWRRRADTTLAETIGRVREADRVARATKESPLVGVLGFVRRVRAPLEWLVVVLAFDWLLPSAVSGLLEVQILVVILTWTFAGRLVVDGLDALAAQGALNRLAPATAGTPGLRHRSLGLVGRVVVVFGVILVLCAKLVGRGAIYEWVFDTCWIVAIPVFLVLVRWWRDVVFARLALLRKPNRYESWVLAHKTGWASFLAAASGGLYLFVTGSYRAVRSWVARFEITRKAMAYLFRRKLDRLGAEKTADETAPLPAAAFDALGPEATTAGEWVPTPSDEALTALAARVRERRGGLIALVGERGMGKTRTLDFLVGGADVARVDVPNEHLDALAVALGQEQGHGPDAGARALGDALDAAVAGGQSAAFFDNAHRLVQPVMGGLEAFDDLLAALGARSREVVWVLTFDEVTWRFLERARATRPVFDDVVFLEGWTEEGIAELLRARTEAVGIVPSFAHLLDALPANADDIDRREALAARETSYYRLLWDHAAGNPGIALDIWRRALGVATDGAVCVSIFHSPDAKDIERLPDAALFVLRAVLQLAPAHPSAITQATMLRPAQVSDSLRYALARGYIEERAGTYRVTWAWFRPIVVFLQRRHLLVST